MRIVANPLVQDVLISCLLEEEDIGVKEEGGYVLGTGPPVQVGHDVVPVSKLWLLRLPVVLDILAEGVDEAEELSSHWGKLDKRGQLLIGAVGRQVTWGKDSF